MIALRPADGFEQVRSNAVEFPQLLDFTEIGMTSIASLGLNVQLLIRRSLVRVQVREPQNLVV